METVDYEGAVGAFTSLEVDSNGYPHISYMDQSNLDLKYARKIQYDPTPPDKPSGSAYGITEREYAYATSAIDFGGDKVKYGWDWDGDSTVDEWSSFYNSDEQIETSHSWEKSGRYEIRVIAEDENGYQSDWSDPLLVSMPLTHQKPLLTLLEKLFDWLEQMFERDILPGIFNL